MASHHCPKCNNSTVIEGNFWNGEGYAHWFVPAHTSTAGLPATSHFLACWSCGHIWANIDPIKLRACIEVHGDELAREKLEPQSHDPFRGLPDCPEARQAAEGVAEIDELVYFGKIVEAIRRYRELTHTKWGQAGDEIRAWHKLKRSRKLAMFGWHTKEEAEEDKTVAQHPMRDRWLDG